jgi:hypothetical protein
MLAKYQATARAGGGYYLIDSPADLSLGHQRRSLICIPYVSEKLTFDLLGSAIRGGTRSGWGLEVPKAREGFGAKGHVVLIRVT